MTTALRRVLIGRIVGLYGVKGCLKIESWCEPRRKIFDYQPWWLTATETAGALQGVSGREQGKGLIAQLPGLDDRDQAQTYVGRSIWVDREALPPLAAGEFYWTDLEGLAVSTCEGVALGWVSHLIATGANDVLVVRAGDKERLLPFVQGQYVHSVDLAAGTITVDWDPDF